jgi:hypothetical protein
MDLNKAIQYAQLVNEAYAAAPNDLANRAGQVVSAGLGDTKADFDIITTIYANDLATDVNPGRGNTLVSIGLVLQAQDGGEAVVAFRGTEGIKEWVLDAHFGTLPCPFLASAGETEDGFTKMYQSVAIGTAADSPSLLESLPNLKWKQLVGSVTICGHSLGGALATLATLDITVNAQPPYHNTTSYTFASPRTGDEPFAAKFDQLVTDSFRVANDLDIVPQLPLFPPYKHVQGQSPLKSLTWIPPRFLVMPNPICEHILTSYLFLLTHTAGIPELPLAAGCSGPASFGDLIKDFEEKWKDLDSLKREFAASPGLR